MPEKKVIFKYKQRMGLFLTAINTTSEASMATWNELRLFFGQIGYKPKTIGAFQQTTKAISKKQWH
jgi:hypothetical protein